MAIRLIEEYPNRVGAPTADYPHGVPRNKSTPTATDGTPFEQSWFRDQEGFFQGLMETAGITPSGQPDTVLNSDYLDALNRVTNGVIEVDMAGAADVSLSAYQGRVAALKLTGALAADVDLIVPDTERMYWIIDETTGDFSVTVKTAAGTGVKLFGESSAVRSDGTNVVPFVNGMDRRVIYVESVAESFAGRAAIDGQQFSVISWHPGSAVQVKPKGGGQFVYRSGVPKSEHNGGTVISPTVPPVSAGSLSDFLSGVGETDPSGTGCFVRQHSSDVDICWFGAVGDGVADDTAACDTAIKIVSESGGGSVYAPAGVYLLGDLKEKIYATSGSLSGYNSWALLYARSNVTFYGDGDNTVLKAADGLVATNADQPGTKGFQVFVHEEYNVAVDNFVIKDFRVDFNGLNNLMEPLNANGNQSLVHGIYIEKGDENGVENVTWENHSGHQIVLFQYDTTNCFVRNCVFRNNGWLSGANSLLTDHSSIYCAGRDWLVEGNILTQPNIVPVGASYELHGSGVARDNYTENYAGIVNIAAIVTDNVKVHLENNISLGTGGGIGIYAQNGYSLELYLKGNDFQLNGEAPTEFPLVGEFKQMFSSGENSVVLNGSTVDIHSSGNRYSVATPISWTTEADDILNAFAVLSGTTANFVSDTIVSFRGPIVEQQRAGAARSVSFNGCEFISCGRSNAWKTENSIVNYTNALDNSYGVRLDTLEFHNNRFFSCVYSAYLDIMQDAESIPVAPFNFKVSGDSHNVWLSPVRGLADIPVSFWNTSYHVTTTPDTVKLLPSAGGLAAQSSGVITAEHPSGWPCEFFSAKDLGQWNFMGRKFDTTAPSTARPFGDLNGDEYAVIFSGGGSALRYKCTASGADSTTLGTWVPLTLN